MLFVLLLLLLCVRQTKLEQKLNLPFGCAPPPKKEKATRLRMPTANAESKGKRAQNNNYVLRQLYCFVFLFYTPPPRQLPFSLLSFFGLSVCFALVIENEIRLIRVMATLLLHARSRSQCRSLIMLNPVQAV